nr:MAG: CHAT domain-containing protein [Candidatus Methanoperedens sp.]
MSSQSPIIKIDHQGYLRGISTIDGELRIKNEEFHAKVDEKSIFETRTCSKKIVSKNVPIGLDFSYGTIKIKRTISEHDIHPAPEIIFDIFNQDTTSHEVVLDWKITTDDAFTFISTSPSVQLVNNLIRVEMSSPFGNSHIITYPYLNIYLCKKHKPNENINVSLSKDSNDIFIQAQKNEISEDSLSIKFDCGIIKSKSNVKCRLVFWYSKSFYDSLGFSGVAFVVDPNRFEDAVSALSCRIGPPHNSLHLPLHRYFTPILFTKQGKIPPKMQKLCKKMHVKTLFFMTKRSPKDCFRSTKSFLNFIRSMKIKKIVSRKKFSKSLLTETNRLGTHVHIFYNRFNCLPLDIQYNMDEIFQINFKIIGVLLVQKNKRIMLSASYYGKKNSFQTCFIEPSTITALLKLKPEYVEIWSVDETNSKGIQKLLQQNEIKTKVFNPKSVDVECIDIAMNYILNCYIPSRLIVNTLIDITDLSLVQFWHDAGLSMEPSEFYQKVTGKEALEFGFPSINGPPMTVLSQFSNTNWMVAVIAATYADAKNAIFLLIRDKPLRIKRTKYEKWIEKINKNLHKLDFFHMDATKKFTELNLLKILQIFLNGSEKEKEEAKSWLMLFAPHLLNINKTSSKERFADKSHEMFVEYLSDLDEVKNQILLIGKQLLKIIPKTVEYVIELTKATNIILFPIDIRIPYEILCHKDRFGDIQTWSSRFSLGRMGGTDFYRTNLLACLSILHSLEGIRSNKYLIVADPKRDLPGAFNEGRILSSILGSNVELLCQDSAKKNTILNKMISNSVLHFACHITTGKTSKENCLALNGNDKLCGGDIPLLSNRPLVFVNSCSGALIDRIEKNCNLAIQFMEKGAIIYISPLYSINDSLSTNIAKNFYLFQQVHPIGYSLISAIRTSLIISDYQDYTAASYILFGDPSIWFNTPNSLATEAEHYRHIGEEALKLMDSKNAMRAYSRASNAYRKHSEDLNNKALFAKTEEDKKYFYSEVNDTLAYALRCEFLAYHALVISESLELSSWRNPDVLEKMLSLFSISGAFLKKSIDLTNNSYNKMKWSSESGINEGKIHYLNALIKIENGNFNIAKDLFQKASMSFQTVLPQHYKLGINLNTDSQIARIIDSEACVHWMNAKISRDIKEAEIAKTLFKKALQIMPSSPSSFESSIIIDNLKCLENDRDLYGFD